MTKIKKVFLGGTCNGSFWREILIPELLIDYFNPVVKDWNDEAYKRELKEREMCDFCLYVITPKMTGVYSIAEVIDDSNKRPKKTIFSYLEEDEGEKFSSAQLKSLEKVAKMVENNGGKFIHFEELPLFLNHGEKKYEENIDEQLNENFIQQFKEKLLDKFEKLSDKSKNEIKIKKEIKK